MHGIEEPGQRVFGLALPALDAEPLLLDEGLLERLLGHHFLAAGPGHHQCVRRDFLGLLHGLFGLLHGFLGLLGLVFGRFGFLRRLLGLLLGLLAAGPLCF